ncbi:MAG: tRNA dihydrouridine(20/20a) synthase DusA [Alphaproteobacteria bacterium]
MNKNFEISVAPMMDWTDRHCRYFHRLIAPHVRLYTEMVTTGALLHGDAARFLRFDEAEHPVALQLGGSEPDALAQCAEMGAERGYDEINLNCGCPSDRVQSGRFGACLMEEPEHVAACVSAMVDAVDIPVTVKCRIGIDERDDFEFLDKFVGSLADKGVKTFIIHARKAWLKGLSPKQNREIPPLDYERVRAIKEKHPQLRIILNGGVSDITGVQEHIKMLDGVMIGREAYSNPYFLAEIERAVFGNDKILGREGIARAMIPYAAAQADQFGTPVKSITRHILGLFHNQPGAKAWKRTLSTLPYEDGAAADVIERALCAQKEAADSQNAA